MSTQSALKHKAHTMFPDYIATQPAPYLPTIQKDRGIIQHEYWRCIPKTYLGCIDLIRVFFGRAEACLK